MTIDRLSPFEKIVIECSEHSETLRDYIRLIPHLFRGFQGYNVSSTVRCKEKTHLAGYALRFLALEDQNSYLVRMGLLKVTHHFSAFDRYLVDTNPRTIPRHYQIRQIIHTRSEGIVELEQYRKSHPRQYSDLEIDPAMYLPSTSHLDKIHHPTDTHFL